MRRGRADRTRPATGEGGRVGAGEGRSTVFRDELRAREVDAQAALEQSLETIDDAARRLQSEVSLAALRDYKEAIRRIVTDAMRRGYRVHTESVFGGGGRRRLLYTVRLVDEQLEQLTRLLLARERDNLAIAARLDSIRGLLLDLYR